MTTKTDINLPKGITHHGIAGHDGPVYTDVMVQDIVRAAVEADRDNHIADVRNMVPSDEELDDLSDEFHGYSGNHTRDGYLIPKFDYLGFARALLSRYSSQPATPPATISRDLLGRIVDEAFDGACEDTSPIEDIYRVIVREYGQPAASAEVDAWRERFPAYEYRPQDECVALKLSAPAASAEPNADARRALEIASNLRKDFDGSDINYDTILDAAKMLEQFAAIWSAASMLDAPVAQEPVDFEHRHAIKQGERNEAEDRYFEARPEFDNKQDRRLFCDGFDRGYEAAPNVAPVAVQPSVPDIPSAMRFAAQVVELYDDATMGGDYMIDSGDCSRILNALADYFSKFAPVAAQVALDPVAEICGRRGERALYWCVSDPFRYPAGTKLYAAPVAAQAQSAVNQQMTTDQTLADTQRQIIEAAEQRGYARAVAECGQDREDAEPHEWMTDESRAPWAINSLKARIKEMRASEKRCRNAFRKDYMRVVSVYFADALGEAAGAFEKRLAAIDAARAAKGE